MLMSLLTEIIGDFRLFFRQLPSIIAENGGYDSAQLVSELKAKHILGESTMVSFCVIFDNFQNFENSSPTRV